MERYWRSLVDVLVAPVDAFRRMRDAPMPLFGLLVAIVAQTVLALGTNSLAPALPVDPGPTLNPVSDVIGTFVAFLVGVGVLHVSARILGGTGSLRASISGLGLAMTPGLFFAPIYVVANLWGAGGIALVASVLLGMWGLLLDVIAIREVYELSTARSIGTLLVALVGLALTVIAFALLIGLIAFAISL